MPPRVIKPSGPTKESIDLSALVARFGKGGQGGAVSIQQDNYGNFKLIENRAGQPYDVFFYVAPNGTDFDIATPTEIVKKYKKDVGVKGLDALRKRLYEADFISKSNYTSKDEAAFNNAILQAANSHGMQQAQKFTLNPDQPSYTFVPFDKWLAGVKGGGDGSGPKVDTNVQITDEATLRQDFNEFAKDLTGGNATEEQKDEYAKLVLAEEAAAKVKAKVKGTTQTTTGTFLNADDYWRISAKVMAPSLSGTPLENIDKIGGKVSGQIAQLKTYAADMGIRLDSKGALAKILEGLTPGGSLKTGDLASQLNSIKELSKARYGNLSDSIDRGLKVSDLANQYAQRMGSLLELPEADLDAQNPYIEKALRNAEGKGPMGLRDFDNLLRQDARYGKTKAAHEDAAAYASSILQSFGFMA